ncbi:universal stress protein [Piscinibacter sakaiensis]|uniref:universal stress protein n=1 Tax=Piscinibacter sakaiensis TaxID=1547922 RepID=UPI003AAC2D09
MFRLGTIVAATDFSALARHAAARAALLAERDQSALTLLHVVPGGALQELRQWLGHGCAAERQLLADAQQQLQPLADALHLAHQIAVSPQIASGTVHEEIATHAESIDADLLVLGDRGEGFLGRLGLGSTSERLLRRTSRPVLVVRQMPQQPYQRVLLPLDFSAWSAPAIDLARRVAPDARLVLLNVFQVPFAEKLNFAGVDAGTVEVYRQQARALASQRLHAAAQSAGLAAGRWEAVIVEGEASRCIVEQEQEQDCDLVVLGKHGQSVAEDLLLGSVSLHVLAEGKIDVLVSTAHASAAE